MLTLDKIYHAAFVLKDVARKTDLIEAPRLSKDCQLYLKTENLQVTGSFKVRGAYYKISQLSKEESDKGVIACSAGNRAQGGKAEDIAQYLSKGNGGVVNSSRGILLAYKKQPGVAFDEAAYNECMNLSGVRV